MSTDSETPFIDLEIDIDSGYEKIVSKAFDVTQQIRPKWKREELCDKKFTDGITNVLIGVYNKNQSQTNGHGGEGTKCDKYGDMILVRVYGHKSDAFIDRNAELNNMKLVGEACGGSKVYARFRNGLAYSFVSGQTVSKTQVRDPEVNQLIVKTLAQMHKIPLKENQSQLFSLMKKILAACPDSFFDANYERLKKLSSGFIVSKADLISEMEKLEAAIDSSAFKSPVVFCHNDLLLGNIVLNDSLTKATFIDFEYGCPNFAAFDIADHFTEFVGVDGDGDTLDYDGLFPHEDFQRDWIRRYLKELKGGEPDDVDIEKWRKAVCMFVLASHLLWGSWSIAQAAHSSIDFDFLDYSMQRINEYKKRKQLYLQQ